MGVVGAASLPGERASCDKKKIGRCATFKEFQISTGTLII